MQNKKIISYIGSPEDNSVMYVSKKVEALLNNLRGHKGCLVFCEDGCNIPKGIEENNEIVLTSNPQLSYAEYVSGMQKNTEQSYKMTEQGYWIGENVTIGRNVRIEPLCVIGHNVVIGDNTVIHSGSKIFRAVIENDVIIDCNVVIGNECFTYTHDEDGNLYKIPTGGIVKIGEHVFIGASSTIEAASSGATIIEPYAKIDMKVAVGHDTVVGRNSELTECAALGGFVVIKNDVFIGMNATVKNRVEIGENSNIGMGCIVTKNIPPNSQMVGNMIGSSIKILQK